MADHTVASATIVASTGTPPTRTLPDAAPPLASSRVLTAAFTALRICTGLVSPVPPPPAVLTLSTRVDTRFRGYERLPDMSETSDEPRRSRPRDAVVLTDA